MNGTETLRPRLLRGSGVLLWVLAPGLLGLSLWRPMHVEHGRAERFPGQLAGFTVQKDLAINPRQQQLLGTQDAVWRIYRDGDAEVYVTCVFHDANWKSLHPPHICLRGSDMAILEDAATPLRIGDRDLEIGRIVTVHRGTNKPYLGYYAFVGHGFVTHSYLGFFLEHAPRALFRSATPGFLLRVETYVGADGVDAAVARCEQVLRAAIPAGEKLIR